MSTKLKILIRLSEAKYVDETRFKLVRIYCGTSQVKFHLMQWEKLAKNHSSWTVARLFQIYSYRKHL